MLKHVFIHFPPVQKLTLVCGILLFLTKHLSLYLISQNGEWNRQWHIFEDHIFPSMGEKVSEMQNLKWPLLKHAWRSGKIWLLDFCEGFSSRNLAMSTLKKSGMFLWWLFFIWSIMAQNSECQEVQDSFQSINGVLYCQLMSLLSTFTHISVSSFFHESPFTTINFPCVPFSSPMTYYWRLLLNDDFQLKWSSLETMEKWPLEPRAQ